MATHINLFGSPGAGKSTNRARLFYELKKRQLKVEEITEHAKQLTYDENYKHLADQTLMLGMQHHNHMILDSIVDYIVTDSPFIMGITYARDLNYKEELKDLAIAMFNNYNNVNIFIERNHKYQEFGRNQTEEESDEKSVEIKKFLNDNNIPFVVLKSGEETIDYILKTIEINQ